MRIALTAGLGWMMCMPAPAYSADADRGKALYEERCDNCHTRSVHVRESRKASSFEGVLAQVARWNAELGGDWSVDEINDVTVYLNNRYYFFRCPESVCRSGWAGRSPDRVTAVGNMPTVP